MQDLILKIQRDALRLSVNDNLEEVEDKLIQLKATIKTLDLMLDYYYQV